MYIYTMEYWIIKRNEILINAITRINPEYMLSERSLMQKAIFGSLNIKNLCSNGFGS